MKNKKLIGVFVVLCIAMAIYAYMLYTLEWDKRGAERDLLLSADSATIYDFYVSSTPSIEQRPFYGDEAAPITIIIYADPKEDSTKTFFGEFFPQLEADFIENKKARLYHKFHITLDDIEQKTDTFKYDKSLLCAHMLQSGSYFGILMGNQDMQSLDSVAMSKCVEEQEFDALIQDALEVEKFNMIGISPRIYIGIEGNTESVIDGLPNYDQIRREIKALQLSLGN